MVRLAAPARRALPLLGLGLALSLQVRAFSTLPHDDAYVTYRYAENLARGRGFVFNPGERVLGFTSPLHALIAALGHALVGHAALPYVMAALGCVAWSAQAFVVFRLLEAPLGRLASGVVAALLLVGGANSEYWVALETNLAVALALGALLAACEGSWLAAGVLAGLASLARPDALVMATLVLVYGAWRLRARVVRPLAAFLVVVLPWIAFSSLYFGSPLPEPLFTKFQRTGFVPYLAHLLREATTTVTGVDDPGTALIALVWCAALLGAVLLVRRAARLGLLVAYGGLHCASYLYLRPFRAHVWHLYPGLLVVALCAWSLVVAPLSLGGPRVGRALSGLASVGFFVAYAWRTVAFARFVPTAHWFGERDATYRAAAAYLRENVRPGERVAAVEVGTLGYYSDAPMYDLGGLVTKHPIIARRPPRPYAWLVADSHYPWLEFEGEAPVKVWETGFPLRLYGR